MEYEVWSMVSGVDMLWKRVIITWLVVLSACPRIRDNHAKPTARGIDKAF